MEIIIEIVLQVFAELVLQILFELGVSGIFEPFRVRFNRYLAIFGYMVFGIISGLLSLIISKQLMIADPDYQKLNILFSALIAGVLMIAIGKFRNPGNMERSETRMLFFCGFVFAFSLSVTRYFLLRSP